MIEIIPKAKREVFPAKDIILYVSLFLFAAVILIFFVLSNLQQDSVKTLDNLEEQLQQSRTKEERTLEANVLQQKKKIDDFAKLFSSRESALRAFDILEKNTHPKVWFNSFEFNAEQMQISLSGKAQSFLALEQQAEILNKEPRVKEAKLSHLEIEKGGTISFDMSLNLAKKEQK